MKKIIIALAITASLCSCNRTKYSDMATCQGDMIVGTVIDFKDRMDSELIVRHEGRLVTIKVTTFEAESYQLGDTIK